MLIFAFSGARLPQNLFRLAIARFGATWLLYLTNSLCSVKSRVAESQTGHTNHAKVEGSNGKREKDPCGELSRSVSRAARLPVLEH